MISKTKKIFSVTLIFLFLIFLSSFSYPKKLDINNNFGTQNLQSESTFENEFFKTNIDPIEDKALDVVLFDEIYAIIEAKISSTYDEQIDNEIADSISALVAGKKVGIATADDLYNLSISAAFNYRYSASPNRVPYGKTILKIMDLDYILLADIDYSTMRGRKFIPLGIDLEIDQGEPTYKHYYFPFTGTFDGQGYVIYNLYLADFDAITTIYRIDDNELTDIDLPLSPNYSMFNEIGSEGIVKNFILEDPIFELLDAPEGVYNTSYLVGENNGLIYNVAVIDAKKNQDGDDISGIRFNIQFQASVSMVFSAGGFVHTNNGEIYNSYFTSENIIVPASRHIFRNNINEFYYLNNGTIAGAAYESESESTQTAVLTYTKEELETGLKDGTAITINDVDLLDEDLKWNYYYRDGYPQLFSLEFKNGYFEIHDEYDLITFTKLISLSTPYGTKPYNEHNYILKENIDMKNILTYKTPSVDFAGQLIGGTSDFTAADNSDAKYIYNLKINKPVVLGNVYYLGFLGTLSGTLSNIIFYNNEVVATNTKEHYGKKLYIGSVASVIENANLKNIISNTRIDLGTEAIGSTDVGGIVGYGNGTLTNIANSGNIHGNTHDFENLLTDGKFNLGGIIGASAGSNLIIHNAINKGAITGLGSSTNYSLQTDDFIQITIGGIIGQVNNATTNGNSIYYVTNEALLQAGSFFGKTDSEVFQYLGGIFGNVINNGFKLVEDDNTTLRNGRLENLGDLVVNHLNDNTLYYTAGIGVASTSSNLADFSYMINRGNYNFGGFTSLTHNKTIFYAATIIDNSTGGIRLSRAYNEADFEFGKDYFVSTTEDLIFRIAPFFTSITNNNSELLYVENKGDLLVGSETEDIDLAAELRIANIADAYKVNYTNVYNSGDIRVLRLNQSKEIYVAGIAWILPYDTDTEQSYKAENLVNQGKIITGGIRGNTEISNVSGTNSDAFTSDLVSRNLYIAGLFNLNVGILVNSFNQGDISSTFNLNIADLNNITGTANTFAGGLVTFNYNLMQDVGNVGNIEYTNSNTSSSTNVANIHSYQSRYGGLIISYNGGLALGGIASAFGSTHGEILDGYGMGANVVGEIIDSSNRGNVYGKANNYVRAGGVLAIALGVELTSGTDNQRATGGNKKFSYSVPGDGDVIKDSNLSNGLNFGNITAVTSVIGQYDKSVNTGGNNDTSANAQRPGIFSVAGGVIAYGLTKMQRMLNHGIVASTDVAGGIIGATYILGTTPSGTDVVTKVDINTAVHYGRIKAIRVDQFLNIDYSTMEDIFINDIDNDSILYEDNNTFIFPTNNGHNLSLYPNRKRGFGGIFGRLQRGWRGSMRSNNFVNILNMDEFVDMVGRVDQSAYSSLRLFLFKVQGVEDTYYTARENDTTQATLVGYVSRLDYYYTSAESIVFRISRSGSSWFGYTYRLTSVDIENANGYYTNVQREAGVYIESGQGVIQTVTENRNVPLINDTRSTTHNVTINTTDTPAAYGLRQSDVSGLSYSNNIAYFTINSPTNGHKVNNFLNTMVRVSPSEGSHESQYHIEKVADHDTDPLKTYIFGSSFPLMDPEQSAYIFPADSDALAERFNLPTSPYYKEYGMYILASSKRSEAGVALPGNIKINKLFKLDESSVRYIDLSNVSDDQLILDGDDVDHLEESYKSMFQLSYNEKSLVIPKDYESNIADLVLYDPTGNSPRLEGGIIGEPDEETGIIPITFTVASNVFINNNYYYLVQSATLSENAVIAKKGIDSSSHFGFSEAYNNRTSNILGGDYQAVIVHDDEELADNLEFTVYSEIAAHFSGLIEKYKTTYRVQIVVDENELDISLTDVYFNNTRTTTPSLDGNTYTIISHEFPAEGYIDVSFLENNGLFPIGHEITFVDLYYNELRVNDHDYQLTIKPVLDDAFGFRIDLNSRFKAGTYTAIFKYYNNTEEFNLVFTKASSQLVSVIATEYSTYSSDSAGEEYSFLPENEELETYIGFGVLLDGILYDGNNPNIKYKREENTLAPAYFDNTTYHSIFLAETEILKLYLAPFATLNSLQTKYIYDEEGYKKYILSYTISPEAGAAKTIVHTISERQLPSLVVYKNGNLENPELIKVEREAVQTEINIDFGFPVSLFNESVKTEIREAGSVYNYTTEEVFFGYSHFYEMYITSVLGRGVKEYRFTLEREAEIKTNLGSIIIEKDRGIDAYLKDIIFPSGATQNLIYPRIHLSDSNGIPLEEPDKYPMFYYNGIDYDDADSFHKHFRIDGIVSEEDLQFYTPTFILPIGATIELWDGTNWVEPSVTDYLGNDEEEVIVKYRIIPEDQNQENIVYYYITATDPLFTLTIRFSLHFQYENGDIVDLDDLQYFNNQVILINVKNYKLIETDENNNPIEYIPTIDEDGKVHYPFADEGIKNYVEAMNTHASLFYFPVGDFNYLYTFGRNLTGAYSFTAITPIYTGPSNDVQKNGKRHAYSIYLKTGAEGTWANPKYLLPEFDEDNYYNGKYFYIVGTTRQQIREFAIVIHEETIGSEWGLDDDYDTWS